MAAVKINEAYKKDLIGQIQAHAEQKRSERTQYLEEGKKMRQQQEMEKAKLEQVSVRRTRVAAVVLPLGAHRRQL